MMELLSNNNLEVCEMVRKYPNGFTFIADQELDMIQEVINISDVQNSVWGCDQSFGASHSIA